MSRMWLALAFLIGLSAAACKPDTKTTIAVEKYKGLIIGMSIVLICVVLFCFIAFAVIKDIPSSSHEQFFLNLFWAIIIATIVFFPVFFTPSAVWGTLIKSIYWKDVNFSVSNITLTDNIHCCTGGHKCERVCVDTCKIVTLNVDITVSVTHNHTELCTYQYSRQCGPDVDEITFCVNRTVDALISAKRRADPNNYRNLSKNFIWTAEKIFYLVLAAISGLIIVVSFVMSIYLFCCLKI